MPIPRIYLDEPAPLDGYEGLTVRVLANASDAEWRVWVQGNLGTPDCEACAAATPDRCPACAEARAAFGRSIVTFYGPRLIDHDVSTPGLALALFDDDSALPSEIVIWLQVLPGNLRQRRTESLLGNLASSVTTPKA